MRGHDWTVEDRTRLDRTGLENNGEKIIRQERPWQNRNR